MSLPTFSFSTSAEEVATTFADEIRGRNVLVTGTSMNGLGFETARVIAKYANLVVITGYNSERLKLSETAIKTEFPSTNIRSLSVDLSSLASVREAAAEINAYPEPLHVLIHNAAALVGPFRLTVDNLEMQMATAHIGPFLLTKLIAPKMLTAVTAHYTPRVVLVSSFGHGFGPAVDFDTLGHPDPTTYDSGDVYFQAKSANILFAIELSKRSNGRINAYSANPGRTICMVFTAFMAGILHPDGSPDTAKFAWKTIPQGAATWWVIKYTVPLDKPGTYLSDSVPANEDIASHSSDPHNAEKLWTVTENIIGEPFTF
ncbi:hypothetical protein FB451DRAFT_1035633 [Mycena latifolia]|nr:hypothetical protein FB451DRAFT_1035633 [Mycena latifolia]